VEELKIRPVTFVSFYDAVRYVNWLHNGALSGAQDENTTEDGAYTLTPEKIANNSVTRNPGALVFLPNENEWYKAAYYHNDTDSYTKYPFSNTAPVCAAPSSTENQANCNNIVGSYPGEKTPVGSYSTTSGPYGTFDQGGNVWEWTEEISEDRRIIRGGSLNTGVYTLASSHRFAEGPMQEASGTGFRVAAVSGVGPIVPVPEPSIPLGLVFGIMLLLVIRNMVVHHEQ
jgi:formylglycine-generating enzyme required for sulfatase activity